MKLPRVVGHRGAAGSAPENTLAGLRRAAELEVGWVEFDVKLTADKRLILMHDDALDRTTDGTGPVAARSFAFIRSLDAGYWFAPAYRGERVPSLEEAVDCMEELGLQANIEIKPSPGEERETALALGGVLPDLFAGGPMPLVSSFKIESLEAIRGMLPELPLGLLIWETPADWLENAKRLGCVSLHLGDRHVTPAIVERAKGARLGVAVYTVNQPVRGAELRRWGVDCLISDLPDILD
jgi:glycerophosphoryl diester phosphodiesterase